MHGLLFSSIFMIITALPYIIVASELNSKKTIPSYLRPTAAFQKRQDENHRIIAAQATYNVQNNRQQSSSFRTMHTAGNNMRFSIKPHNNSNQISSSAQQGFTSQLRSSHHTKDYTNRNLSPIEFVNDSFESQDSVINKGFENLTILIADSDRFKAELDETFIPTFSQSEPQKSPSSVERKKIQIQEKKVKNLQKQLAIEKNILHALESAAHKSF